MCYSTKETKFFGVNLSTGFLNTYRFYAENYNTMTEIIQEVCVYRLEGPIQL